MRSRALLAVVALGAGCSSISTARLQPETVEVGPGMRPVAAIQASVSSFYFALIPIPGGLDLDRVINRMLIVTAKTMGADKVTNLTFHIDCPAMCFSRILGVLEAHAHGIAVQVEAMPADPGADDGPEARPR